MARPSSSATVAFFAAWSVLSNLFCAMLIFTVGPFRVGDVIEVLDTQDTGGARGRVIDINLLYTTLEDLDPDTAGTRFLIWFTSQWPASNDSAR